MRTRLGIRILAWLGVALLGAAGTARAGAIDAMATIPSEGIKVVERDGELLFLSANGRFLIRGQLYDAWQMQPLNTLADINRAAGTIDLDKLKLDLADLRPLTLGRGDAPPVVVFVDPHCPHCQRLLESAKALFGEYRFAVLPIGILGPDSARDVRRLGCAGDRGAAAAALLSHAFDDLAQIKDCDLEPLRRTLVTAQVFGVEGVPFLIAPDGTVQRGAPPDLKQWLAAHGG